MSRYAIVGAVWLALAALSAACTASSFNAAQPTAAAVATQSAPTVQAQGAQTAPTLSAAETQVAPTLNAVRTEVAPTAKAVTTAVAPTANAASTSAAMAATQVPAQVATASAQTGLRITGAELKSSDQTVTVQNTSQQTIDLSAWTLQIGASPVKLPLNANVAPGSSLVLHATDGTTDNADIYLGSVAHTALSALHPGEQITLENPSGAAVASYTVPGA
jgi:lamin tail-like protein